MRTSAILLSGILLAVGPSAASPGEVVCGTAIDNYGYTWELFIEIDTGLVTGSWDTTSIGCPVYDVRGSYRGGEFTFMVTQDETTTCDTSGVFEGIYDRVELTGEGTYVGEASGGPHDWTWVFKGC
jgi:hypothetical protein